MGISELELLEWLSVQKQSIPELRLGIGDDMAAIDVPGGRIFLSSDMLLDGVHFDTDRSFAPPVLFRLCINKQTVAW